MKYDLKYETKINIYTNLKIGKFWYIFESHLKQDSKTKKFKFNEITAYFYNSDSIHSSEQQPRGFDDVVNESVDLKQIHKIFYERVKQYLDKKGKSDKNFRKIFQLDDVYIEFSDIYSSGWGDKNDLKSKYAVVVGDKSTYFSDSIIYKNIDNSKLTMLPLEKTYSTNLEKSLVKNQTETKRLLMNVVVN